MLEWIRLPGSPDRSLFDAAEKKLFLTKAVALVSERKRNPNPNFLVRISSGGVRVFHVKGWVPKSSECPSKIRETKRFGAISRDCCLDIPGAPEKLKRKKLVFHFRPHTVTSGNTDLVQLRRGLKAGSFLHEKWAFCNQLLFSWAYDT